MGYSMRQKAGEKPGNEAVFEHMQDREANEVVAAQLWYPLSSLIDKQMKTYIYTAHSERLPIMTMHNTCVSPLPY